jgi:hypothetical protein
VGWRTTANYKEYLKRYGARRARLGRAQEENVEAILLKMREQGLIADFKRSRPNSKMDAEGKDFSVTMLVGGVEVVRHFGMTISMKSRNNARVRYPDVPQFVFPVGTNPSTIERRILELFSE